MTKNLVFKALVAAATLCLALVEIYFWKNVFFAKPKAKYVSIEFKPTAKLLNNKMKVKLGLISFLFRK